MTSEQPNDRKKVEEDIAKPSCDHCDHPERPIVWKTWVCPHEILIRHNGVIKTEKW